MGGLDRQVRNEAVTMRASFFGHNYEDETDYDLRAGAFTPQGGGYSDLCDILGVSTTTGAQGDPISKGIHAFRVLQPAYGEIVECYIDIISVHYPFDAFGTPGKNGAGSNDLKVFIGDFTDNDFMTPRTDYTVDEVTAQHELITGSPNGWTVSGGGDARTIRQRVNLLPALKKSEHPLFVKDGFLLGLMFNNGFGHDVSQGGTDRFRLEFLRLSMSITGIK